MCVCVCVFQRGRVELDRNGRVKKSERQIARTCVFVACVYERERERKSVCVCVLVGSV